MQCRCQFSHFSGVVTGSASSAIEVSRSCRQFARVCECCGEENFSMLALQDHLNSWRQRTHSLLEWEMASWEEDSAKYCDHGFRKSFSYRQLSWSKPLFVVLLWDPLDRLYCWFCEKDSPRSTPFYAQFICYHDLVVAVHGFERLLGA